jgi:hypothetical protein
MDTVIRWAGIVAGGLAAAMLIALAITMPWHRSAAVNSASGGSLAPGAPATSPSATATTATSTGTRAGSGGTGGSAGSGSPGSAGSSAVTSLPVPTETVGNPGKKCLNPYVWRKAFPSDYACVPPHGMSQAAADDAAALSRIEPGGGANGKYTCKPGYVWRQIVSDDYVCVTPAVHNEAMNDDAQISDRILLTKLWVTDYSDNGCSSACIQINGDLFNFSAYSVYVYTVKGTLIWDHFGVSATADPTVGPGGTFSLDAALIDCSASSNPSSADNAYVYAVDQATGTESAEVPIIASASSSC